MRFSEETLRRERDKKLRSGRAVHEGTSPYFEERWGSGDGSNGGDDSGDDDEEGEDGEDREEEHDKEDGGWRGYFEPHRDGGGSSGLEVRDMPEHVSGTRLLRVRSFASW